MMNETIEQKQCKDCGVPVTPKIIHPNLCVDCAAKHLEERRTQQSPNHKPRSVVRAIAREREVNAEVILSKQYIDYMQSPQWLVRREAVLQRDEYICQACCERTATEVHHLNYDHLGNEPMFDLVSVCHDCHEQITKMDREK